MLKIKQVNMKIPPIAINRLSIYYRCLERLVETQEGRNLKTISSDKISLITGINSTQVRKDLAYFGEFGKRGIGYPIAHLSEALRKILGFDRKLNILIIGAGNLGKALVDYKGFKRRGFLVKGIFDNNPQKIGKAINDIFIYNIEDMEKYIEKWDIKIVAVAVPADSAQEIVNRIIDSGIKSILNFAPICLQVPNGIRINNVDLSIELERLSYYLSSE